MYLKRISANGFKSFANKIDIEVNRGITGIVGPNGSGKSNVLDAIRWVMGEQSVKALRGDNSMTDIIFAGSKSRSASTRASVSLTFDNQDHYLKTDFNEIEIKRVVYKTGENEYYLNNTKVRLKDITDLFLDSGAGKESFNIISQGAVADIINSKPEERRIIFEEASGVLKYKKRKEESYRKLEKTNENLDRVELLIDELSSSLEPLKEQSTKAQKYLELKDSLKNIEISLIANDIETLNEEYITTKNNIDRLNNELESLDTANSVDNTKVENLKLESLKIDSLLETKNDELLRLTKTIADLESQKQITTERQKYEYGGEKLENNLLNLKEEVLNLQNQVKALEEELKNLKLNLETKTLQKSELSQKIEEKRNSKLTLNQEYNHNEKEILNLQNKIEILAYDIEHNAKLPSSVKNILNNPRLKGVHGTISNVIEFNEEYTIAIETSLGANSNCLIVDNEQSAKEAINYLKENKLGRATFFPITVIKSRSINSEDLKNIKEQKGFVAVASSLIKTDELYQNIIENQLGNVIVTTDLDALNRISKLTSYKYKIVTLEGEVSYPGGAINGGTNKNNTLLNAKNELDRLKTDLKEKEETKKDLEIKLTKSEEELSALNTKLEDLTRVTIIEKESLNAKQNTYNTVSQDYANKNKELSGTENILNGSLDKELENILTKYYDAVAEKESLTTSIDKLKKDKSDLSESIAALEKEYREKNFYITQKQNTLKAEEIKKGKIDVKLDNLLKNLSENYNITYEKAHSEYTLDLEEGIARQTVNSLKNEINKLGEVNLGSIKEYERLNERNTFLTTQRDDLKASVTSLLEVIAEMDEIMKNRFLTSFEKIKQEFQVVFKHLFKGGEGILELTNPEDLLTTGIEIKALPPGKKLNSIALLSGGEKTLTAIALLFAILNVKPVPFVVLDEVEAALDEANVDAFGHYLLSRKERSQFIIITHKKRTMEYADALYGITMQESGVSKLVSVKLE